MPWKLLRLSTGKSQITQHIKSENHKLNINKSEFNDFILEIEDKYRKINSERKAQPKPGENVETAIPIGEDEELEKESLGAPTKKVKRDQEYYKKTVHPSQVHSVPIPPFFLPVNFSQ